MKKCVAMGCPYAAQFEETFQTEKGEVVLLELCAFHKDIERRDER